MHEMERPGRDTIVRLSSAGLSAEICPHGAELRRLQDAQGRDLLWDGDPAWWGGRAPILFPAIGLMSSGGYMLDGHHHAMPKHGFARDSLFQVAALAPEMVALRLIDDETTRAAWPFRFGLDIVFSVEEATLTAEAAVTNMGGGPMPASFGFHPAFRWPLPYGAPREAHRIRMAEAEPDPIRRIGSDGLLLPDPLPTPFSGRDLTPRDALFEEDAIILDRVRSRSLVYDAPGTPGLRVEYDDLPMLALWTRPGAPFLCIEPWQGLPDPQGYAGDIRDKPGIVTLAPGETRRFAMDVSLVPADSDRG